MKINSILVIASFLLTASFAFADGKAIPIPLPNNVFIVENDQSVQKTERVATIEHRPTSWGYVVRGRVQHRDVEGTAYLEMWSLMPDGSRYFSRTLAEVETVEYSFHRVGKCEEFVETAIGVSSNFPLQPRHLKLTLFCFS